MRKKPIQDKIEDKRATTDVNLQPSIVHHDGSGINSTSQPNQDNQKEDVVMIDTRTFKEHDQYSDQRQSKHRQSNDGSLIFPVTVTRVMDDDYYEQTQQNISQATPTRSTISSNIVNYFNTNDYFKNCEFRVIVSLQETLNDILDYETYSQIVDELNQTEDRKQLSVSNFISKEALEINQKENYISQVSFSDILKNDDKITYYLAQRIINNKSRVKESVKKILSQNLQKYSEYFLRRLVLQKNSTNLLAYMKIRSNQDQQIQQKEWQFIQKIFFMKAQERKEAFDILTKNKLLGLEEISDIRFIKEIHRLTQDILQANINNKQQSVEYIKKMYKLQNNRIEFYINSIKLFKKKLKTVTAQLQKSIELRMCAQCGSRPQIFNLHKDDKWKQLAKQDMKTRAQFFYGEYEQYVTSKLNDQNEEIFWVCYYCDKHEINFDVKERSIPVPQEIRKLKSKAEEGMIRLGYIYSFIRNLPASTFSAMHGDTNFKLFNSDIGMHKLALNEKWMQTALDSKQKANISIGLSKLKECNPLYSKYLCTFELWQNLSLNKPLRDVIENETYKTRLYKGYDQDTFIIKYPSQSINEESTTSYIFPSNQDEAGYDILNIRQLDRIAAFEEYVRRLDDDESVLQDINNNIQIQTQEGIEFFRRNTVYYADKFLEEKLWPTLLPTGEGGYNSSYLQSGMTITQYAKMRLMSCRNEFRDHYDYIFWLYDRKRKEQMLSYSRGVKAAHPGQHEKPLTMKDIQTQQDIGDFKSYYWTHRLSRKMAGTPSYFISKGEELQTMCEEGKDKYNMDGPSLFLTATGNPKDQYMQKLKETFGKRHRLQHALATCSNIYIKTRILMQMVKGGSNTQGIFGKVLMYFERYEFQARGPPHLHVLLWLDQEGEERLKDGVAVQAIIPDYDEELSNLVNEHMVHRCVEGRCYKEGEQKKCRQGYPQPLSNFDYVDDQGYFRYKRLTEEDRQVVPYNSMVLKFMQSSCCVMRLTQRETLKYLTKYVSKQEPTLLAKLMYNYDDPQQKEVLKYLKLGQITVCEAIWLLLRLPMVLRHPNVIYFHISQPGDKMRILKKDIDLQDLDPESIDIFQDGPLDYYYKRPIEYELMTFFEFIKGHMYTRKKNSIPKNVVVICNSRVKGYTNVLYYKRTTPVIVSTNRLYPSDGEIYYFGLYLKHVHHRRYRQFHDHNKEKSWYIECILRGLISMNSLNIRQDFRNLWRVSNLSKIKLQQSLLEILRDKELSQDQRQEIQGQKQLLDGIIDEDLEDLKHVMADFIGNKKAGETQDYKFFNSQLDQPEVDRYFRKQFDWNTRAEKVLVMYIHDQLIKQQLSEDQIGCLEYIYHKAITRGEQVLAFITGGAGNGKSHMLKLLHGFLFYVLKKKVAMTASTGIAAGNINGQTIHSLLSIHEKMQEYHIDPLSELQKTIGEIEFLVIDEISLLTERTFIKVEAILKMTELNPLKRQKLFGGKHVILCGDLLQTQIIGASNDRVANCCSMNEIFQQNFHWIVLDQNFRQNRDNSFKSLIDNIRMENITQEVIRTLESRQIDIDDEKTKWVMKQQQNHIVVGMKKNALKYNQYVGQLLNKDTQTVTLIAEDYEITKNDAKQLVMMEDKINIDKLNAHKDVDLKRIVALHKNSKIMITRNFDLHFQMANGTLAQLLEVGPNNKYLKILNLKTREVQYLGRHSVTIYAGSQTKLQRNQFAVEEAYASTVHKVQGLTLNGIVIDCADFFAPGQFYTAITRCPRLHDVYILNFNQQCLRQSGMMIEQYKNRTEQWQIMKRDLKAEKITGQILQRLESAIQGFDSDMVKEIYNKLEQANLNLMIETGYKQLFNDDPALDQDQIDQDVAERMDEEGNMVVDEDNNQQTQQIQEDIKHTQDQAMKEDEEEKTQQILIKPPVIEEVKENPFLANKGHDLQNNPFIRRNNNQLRYPFARWFNNSCLHDCLMYIFYFGIYNQHQEIHNRQVDPSLRPLINSCIELDKIDINRTYQKSTRRYPICERQFNAIQPLRIPYGGDMIDAEELKEYFQDSSHFSLTVNRQESCGHCGYEDQEQTLQEYMINIVELSNGKVSEAVKNYYNQQRLRCPACNHANLTIKGTLLLAPDYLVVAVRRGANPRLKLDDKIRFKLVDNTVVKYEIKGIIYYSRYGSATTAGNHFVAKLKDGVHKDGTEMKGWWYYDGKMDHDLNVVKETDLTSALNIRSDAPREIIYPNILFYKRI